MNSSGQALLDMPLTGGSDGNPTSTPVNRMVKTQVQAELRSYLGERAAGPSLSGGVRRGEEWQERRAALWLRLSYLIELEKMINGDREARNRAF